MKLPPPMPQWAKYIKPNSRVTNKEIAELFGIHSHYVARFMNERMISFNNKGTTGYAKLRHYYLWSDVLEVYNNEIKEAEKLESLNKKV